MNNVAVTGSIGFNFNSNLYGQTNSFNPMGASSWNSSAACGATDGFLASEGLTDLAPGGGSLGALGAMSSGLANPLMGLSGLNSLGGGDSQQLLASLLPVLQMIESLGLGGQNPAAGGGGSCGGGGVGPGDCGLAPSSGCQGVSGCSGEENNVVQLQKGQTYTTPDGTTYNWTGDTIKVSEAGNGQSPNAGSATCQNDHHCCHDQKGQSDSASGARSYSVFGDPHIKQPDGSQANFSKPGGLLATANAKRSSDGDQISGDTLVVNAPGSNKPVTSASIVEPGGNVNQAMQAMNMDPSETTNWGNGAGGQFQDQGTVDQSSLALGGGGGWNGNEFFNSPWGESGLNGSGFASYGTSGSAVGCSQEGFGGSSQNQSLMTELALVIQLMRAIG